VEFLRIVAVAVGLEKKKTLHRKTRRHDMPTIASAVEVCMRENDLKFQVVDPEKMITRCGFSADNGDFSVFFIPDEKSQTLRVHAYCPNHVPEEHRLRACEFITRANYGLRIGNFEMDMDDGELRYKVSVDVEGGELTSKMVSNMKSYALAIMDRYYPGLMALLYGGATPADAIKLVEDR